MLALAEGGSSVSPHCKSNPPWKHQTCPLIPADDAFAYCVFLRWRMSRKICIEYGLGICAEVQAQQESGREAEGAGAVWPGGLHTAACQVSS